MPLLPFWACAGYTAVYVGSIYVLPKVYGWLVPGRPVAEKRKRNEPIVIHERLWSVSVATLFNLLGTAYVVCTSGAIQSKVCKCAHDRDLMVLRKRCKSWVFLASRQPSSLPICFRSPRRYSHLFCRWAK